MTEENKKFYQGFAGALAEAARHSIDTDFVLEVMDSWGVTIAMLEESDVDDNDLQEILKATKF